jgi:hypothetical protein
MSRRRVMMMLFSLSALARAFVLRVEADGGVVESAKCIDKKLK